MLNSRPGTPTTITRYLETLKHNAPHRPAGQRAQRFIDLVPAIEAAFVRMGPMETVELLSAATQAVAAIIGTELLNHDDHADLKRAAMRLLEKNIARLGSSEVTVFITGISPALRADRCGFVSLIESILPYLSTTQLKRLDRALRKTPVRASDPYHASARHDRLLLRRKIACLAGDSALYFHIDAQCAARDQILTARVLFSAGILEDAMRMLNLDLIERRPSPRSDHLRADILAAQGAVALAQDVRLLCFQRDLCADALRDYVRQAPDFEDIIAEEAALTFAATFPDPRRSVRFFLRYDRPDLAAERVLAETDIWSELDTWGQDHAAADLAPHQPLAASILLRGLVIRILTERDRTAFRQARRHLKQLGAMAILADPDNRRPVQYQPHALWMASLRERMISCGFLRPEARREAAA